MSLAAGLLLLSGCGEPTPGDYLDDYLQRLENTLEVSADVAPDSVSKIPKRRALKQSLPSDSIGIIDFLALGPCELQTTVARMNGSLGRQAGDSQRLLLDLEFLRLAPACVAALRAEGEPELAAQIERAWQARKASLPERIYNATLANAEFQAFWRPGAALKDYPAQTSSEIIAVLDSLTYMAQRWLHGHYEADNTSFELLLGEAAAGDGGLLMQALARQSAALAAADAMLAQRRQRGPLCEPNRRHSAADILPAVVQKRFISEVQPHSADLNRRYHDLLPSLRELEVLLQSALPTSYRDWQAERDRAFAHWLDAPKRHVANIQLTLAPCRNGDGPL